MTEGIGNIRVLHDYEQWRHVRKDLKDTTSEPVNTNSDSVIQYVQEFGAAGVKAMIADTPIEQLPYGLTFFPRELLKRFSKDGEPPVIPDSTEAIDAAIDSFLPGQYSALQDDGERTMSTNEQDKIRQTLQKMLHSLSPGNHLDNAWTRALRSLVGNALVPEQWWQYTTAQKWRMVNDQRYSLDDVSYTPMRNFDFNEGSGVFQVLTGRHRSFLFTGTSYSPNMTVLPGIRIPIGPYRKALAKKILLTASFMGRFNEQDSSIRADAVTADNKKVIAHNTTRAKGRDECELARSFWEGVHEGDEVAMAPALALLTSHRLKGYDAKDYDRLIRQIYIDDKVNELALWTRESLIASVALYGVFGPPPMDVKRNGHLQLRTEFIEVLQALQEISNKKWAEKVRKHLEEVAIYEIAHREWERLERTDEPPQRPQELIRTGLPCPYAGMNHFGGTPQLGAISRRTPAMYAVYECV